MTADIPIRRRRRGNAIVIVGAQWGDEGKGKVVDEYAGNADMVIRFNGGANAGHSLHIGGEKFVTHLLPSGIVRRGMINIVGPGVVCSLDALREELVVADRCGSSVFLDRSAPVIHAIHRWFDAARESGGNAIGTTKRGIGPAYEDVGARRTVSLGDLVNPDRVRNALIANGYYLERLAAARSYIDVTIPFPTLDEVIHELMSYRALVMPRLHDTRLLAHQALADGKFLIFEGAQGVMLDVYYGSKPYTTSSGCTAAAVGSTFGVHQFDAVIGVAKAYVTRVGEGPFPTELNDTTGEKLRKEGHEFGSTTGRPRRCGWLDLPALDFAGRMGGITQLIITKLDILSAFESIKVCTDYEFEGRTVGPLETLTTRVLRETVPRLLPMKSWGDLQSCRNLHDLPATADLYLDLIRQRTGLPIVAVGTGPEREQLIR